jgi:hypothetical protein
MEWREVYVAYVNLLFQESTENSVENYEISGSG